MAHHRPFLFRSTSVALVLFVAMLTTAGAASTGLAQSTTLRPLADAAAISLGAAVDVDALDDAGYRALLVDHVNLVSTKGDLSMAVVQPEQGVFDFSRAESIVDFAVEHDMVVRGHELIGGAVPGWVSAGSWTAESLGQVLRDHVTAVVGHFEERNPGVVVQWDVVAEAFLADGTPRPTVWQQVIGDDHFQIAFEAARDADPEAVLFYDDFYDDVAVTQDAVASGVPIVPGANAERTTCDAVPKCVGVRDRIAALVADGVPIDGAGFQSHLFSPDPADFTQFTAWVGELGLNWALTEFDVPLPVTEIANPETLEFQAREYADALAACVDAANCDTFVTWGITDRFSSIPAETGGAFDGALWFDVNDQPKPAFDAMAQVLTESGPAPSTPSTDPGGDLAAGSIVDSTAVTDGSDGSDGDSSPVVAALVGLAALGAIAAVVAIARRRRSSPTPNEPRQR
jgi:GH35 family endo-1,4-beta-xylanase